MAKTRKQKGGVCFGRSCKRKSEISNLIDILKEDQPLWMVQLPLHYVSKSQINTPDNGVYAVFVAAQSSYKKGIMKALIKKGANFDDAVDMNNDRPLHYAANANNYEAVREICEALTRGNRIIDSKNEKGETALMRAVINLHEDCVKVLLDYGAKPNLRNERGESAIEIIGDIVGDEDYFQEIYDEIYELLVAHGATPPVTTTTIPFRIEEENVGKKKIPKGTDNSISYNTIENGDDMVNFDNEFEHERYYKRSTFNSFPTPKKNPSTRKLIKTIRRYKANVNNS